jgi:hypothetical protein
MYLEEAYLEDGNGEKHYSFQKGINVIIGPDEAGKSRLRAEISDRIRQARESGRPDGSAGISEEQRYRQLQKGLEAGRTAVSGWDQATGTPVGHAWGGKARHWNPLMTAGVVLFLIVMFGYRSGNVSRAVVIPACAVFALMVVIGAIQEKKKMDRSEASEKQAEEPEEAYPVIVDESFESYSDAQLRSRFREMADWNCQVFLTKCHSREIEILKSLGLAIHPIYVE